MISTPCIGGMRGVRLSGRFRRAVRQRRRRHDCHGGFIVGQTSDDEANDDKDEHDMMHGMQD